LNIKKKRKQYIERKGKAATERGGNSTEKRIIRKS
jgi:hypothetical protein